MKANGGVSSQWTARCSLIQVGEREVNWKGKLWRGIPVRNVSFPDLCTHMSKILNKCIHIGEFQCAQYHKR